MLGVLCVDTAEPVFALTYDDGPDPAHTPSILDVLADHGARATFFVLTDRAMAHRDLVARIMAEGHEVQLHGRDHKSMLTRGFWECRRHLGDAQRELESIGVRATLYRPPYMQFRATQMFAARSRGLTLALASGDSRDWEHDEEESIAMRGAAAVFPGAALLMHDSRADPETARSADEIPRFDRAAVLDLLLRNSSARGLQAVTMTELLSRAPAVAARAYHRSR
ncbi:polysaccharide deacetylase family protein [Microbacterium profundi]|uniref:polysaccharide deacetylase family protein n=1 Tax=Microbacterium profundi TaxID=450380 RepID=UPI001F2205E6|nr:polysaccharide deacetylase family protein [Microbacterium profundi]MCE7481976.1 polysaccharide deacetylase family protein [Microbacterium profundi]